MAAVDHTRAMQRWWREAGIERADLAVRRKGGTMIWHRDRPIEELPLSWARAENATEADIYVRPSRGSLWPFVFLDDVGEPMAFAIARKYRALAIRTSPAGGCHVWLATASPVDEDVRREAQRWLAYLVGADQGSVSGEHLGRLAGFRNWKRAGTWVNVAAASRDRPTWTLPEDLGRLGSPKPACLPGVRSVQSPNLSESERDGLVSAPLSSPACDQRMWSRGSSIALGPAEALTPSATERTVTRALAHIQRSPRRR